MPDFAVLKDEIQDFINQNLQADLPALILKGSPFKEVSIQEIAAQIEAKQKAKKKLPTWFNAKNILYPPTLNLEQTSSEVTARHKAILVNGKVIDLTGGFGIDSHFFCKKAEEVWHCEINTELSLLATHNHKILAPKCKMNFVTGNGLEFLKNESLEFDWVYIDPSRREKGKKVFLLENSTPNILENLEWISKKTQKLLIKTSPLLDINRSIQQLKWVNKLHIVAIDNEVKELLWVVEPNYQTEKIKVECFNYKSKSTEKFTCLFSSIKEKEISYSKPQQFLYEPNAAIMKSACFQALAEKYSVKKIAANTHLFTADQQIDFPGRRFKILEKLHFSKKALANSGIKKANIATRNFVLSVEQIRKKFKIKDGGETYLFFVTTQDEEKMILVCEKI
ncbi:THUMP-like domain-containing protein [Haloflavibacter putidus]|uniref:Class I SAM-dependent methyltransferase n=1 Tax=Haloflavibacter putidus TaxID=2576776 RepID=A0A507ZVE0_9FLAO|nr:class I SAM-dependent methyltransferase [Haloflavibacter putidus]TQD40204.1 class I SAM-dependent methyltransferase [Haloflavibacter putidus]